LKLLDTVVLIGAIRENDRHHKKAFEHLKSLERQDVYLPSTALLEFDLELKAHGYTIEERIATFEDLAALIPPEKVLPLTPTSLREACRLESEMSYFDAMIVALAREHDAAVVTTDREIRKRVRWEW